MITATIKMTSDPIKNLALLRKSLQARVLKPAIRAALTPAKADVKAATAAMAKSGHLAKAIDIKIGGGKRGKSVYGMVGPRSAYFALRVGKRWKKAKGKYSVWAKAQKHDDIKIPVKVPAKYAHLVELGHDGKHPAPPHPFLGPLARSRGPAYIEIMRQKAEEGIARELAKVKK